MTRNGFTLVEVIIAIFILGVGVLALFGLQTSSLQQNRNAVILQELNDLARSEMELQREYDRVLDTTSTNQTCSMDLEPSGFSCAVAVYPCTFASGALTCQSGTFGSAPARQIVVMVSEPGGRSFSLSTVVKTKFVLVNN